MTHAPERTCTGCRTRRVKPELLRIGVNAEGTCTLDVIGRMTGRGAYVCAATAVSCLTTAQRRHQLARSLRVGHGVIAHSELQTQIAAHLAGKETQTSPPR